MSREAPVILNPEGRIPGLVVVDHAGTRLPGFVGDLGIAPRWRRSHHFYDIGVEALARAVAARLDIPVVLGTVSRLVIDLNRWIEDPRSILERIEGHPIPANVALSEQDRHARQEFVFYPYHEAIGGLWAAITGRHTNPFFFALHSCTRVVNERRRPWDGGTIWHEDGRLSQELLAYLGRDGSLCLGDNEPYSGHGGVYTIDRHTYGRGVRACGFEVSNDLLENRSGQAAWADRLAGALAAMARLGERA